MLFLPPAIKCGIAVAGLAASLVMGTMGLSNIDQPNRSERVLQAPITGQVNIKGYPVVYEVTTTKKGGVTIKYNKKDGVANFEYHRDTDCEVRIEEQVYLEKILEDVLAKEETKEIRIRDRVTDLIKETYYSLTTQGKKKSVKES